MKKKCKNCRFNYKNVCLTEYVNKQGNPVCCRNKTAIHESTYFYENSGIVYNNEQTR